MSNEMMFTVLADMLGNGNLLQIQPDPSELPGYSVVSQDYISAEELRQLTNSHGLTVLAHAVDPEGQLKRVEFHTVGTKATLPEDLGAVDFDQPAIDISEILANVSHLLDYLEISIGVEAGAGAISSVLLILSENPNIKLV